MNERQRLFAKEYLIDLNGKEAARRAGYSLGTAANTASRLLAEPEIAALVAKGKEQIAAKRRLSADRVLEELGRMAFSNMRDYVDWGPEGMTLRDKSLLDADETAAVADIQRKGNGQVVRLKLYDKLAALNALARHLGMIGGKTALAPPDNDDRDRRAANAELRERLLRIARGEDEG
ncbi:MAG TPA: terminase small subunit [Stellaceae bacterium]|nr:terminase small subunit [Stellaceae bacterium]